MPERKPSAAKKPPQREGRRLRLLDHLGEGAFSNESLQDASAKIARLTRNRDQIDERPSSSLGEITDSITDSDTGLFTDSISTSPIQSPIQSPIDGRVKSPNDSPNEIPKSSSNDSPNGSPIQSPQPNDPASEVSKLSWEHVLLTENQAILYVCLKHIGGAVTSLSLISQAAKISEHTLKSALKKLRKHGLIIYGGRKNSGGRFGFTAEVIERPIVLRGDRARLQDRLRQIDARAIVLISSLNGIEVGQEGSEDGTSQLELDLVHLMDHRLDHRFSDPSLSSSSKNIKLQLQDLEISLLLERHFYDLDVRSLEPYLDQFDSVEALQNFLDMANASIEASKTNAKPIQNPHGFLFAQLRAGYVNPPPGFKSRRVLVQEVRNAQLQAELDALRQLQEQEAELRFELFKANLSDEQKAELEQEAARRVQPKAAVSRERQMAVYRDEVLRAWFEQARD
jgi:hypothetical protein